MGRVVGLGSKDKGGSVKEEDKEVVVEEGEGSVAQAIPPAHVTLAQWLLKTLGPTPMTALKALLLLSLTFLPSSYVCAPSPSSNSYRRMYRLTPLCSLRCLAPNTEEKLEMVVVVEWLLVPLMLELSQCPTAAPRRPSLKAK